ncbi:MAG: T9SS type A sorting domain-containing protein, partial [Bacteroidota bacterium]
PEKAPNSIPQIVDNGDFITVFLNRDKESSPFLSFSIFNLQGVVCLDGHINGRSVVFSKQALPAGLYLLQIHGLQPVFQPLIIR